MASRHGQTLIAQLPIVTLSDSQPAARSNSFRLPLMATYGWCRCTAIRVPAC
jgi:hypothetical protein